MGKEMLRISDQNKDALCPRQYLIVHSFWSSEKYVSFRKTVLLLWANIYKLCMVDEKKKMVKNSSKLNQKMAKHVSRDQNIIGPVPNASSESTLWWRNSTFTNNSPLWKQIVKNIKYTIWDNSIGTGSFDFQLPSNKTNVQSLLFYAPNIYLNKDKK